MKWTMVGMPLLLLAGCVSGPPTHSEVTQHPLYGQVRNENMGKITQGLCEVGMSAAECVIAWKGCHFEPIRKAETRAGFYDIYRVNRGDRIVYLHFKDLILVRVAEYP